ncbi:hypothetical protein ACLOJK_006722 [Asimina triloba]
MDLLMDGEEKVELLLGAPLDGAPAGLCCRWVEWSVGVGWTVARGLAMGVDELTDGGSWSGHGCRWVDGRWLVVWPWASICCRPGEMGAAGDGGLDGWIEMAPDGGSRGGRGLLIGAGCDGPRWRLDGRR